jgi:iron complex outermembrane receptor protein
LSSRSAAGASALQPEQGAGRSLIADRERPTMRALGALFAAFVLPLAAAAGTDASTSDLKALSVEDLMNVEITSVSKTAAALSTSAAAVYVITHDDVVRSGATSLPEVLRLAPNLQVFQTSPSNYIVTARGFSGNSAAQSFSDKLLVLIDGRSVYSPLYSGVYWDAQDVLLEDIERIEVISGPGATLWGANAVNGVINIITRKSEDTQGVSASVGAGNIEKDASAQVGGTLAHAADSLLDSATYRVYVKGFERGAFDLPSGASADDGWSKAQAGFRTDLTHTSDTFTVQGDFYRANEQVSATPDLDIAGANLLARWQRQFSPSSALEIQSYYDQTQRFDGGGGGFVLNTYDLSLQHSFTLGTVNSVVWGAGDRVSRYGITDTATLLFRPDARTLNLADIFAQDTLALAPRLKATVGLKLEDDPYSGTTPLPNVRLAWNASDSTFLWSSVSRAIRSPTPFDRDVAEYLSGTLFLVGGAGFKPERLTAYEVGYRAEAASRLSVSVSTFYNSYDNLRSIEYNPTTLLPLYWGNGLEGHTYGVESWANYQASERCVLAFGFTQMYETLHFKPGSSGLLGVAQAGDDPSHQAHFRPSINLPRNLTFDADLRYVGTLPNPEVHAYEELNARLGWRVSPHWGLALAGANLLHARHQEFTVPPSDAITRSVRLDAHAQF